MRTQVAIIGAGPAGALLSHMLTQQGISNVVIERQSREYVLGRIRAGVLEWGTVETLREVGLGERMDAEGHTHETINIAWRGQELLSVNTQERVGRLMMAYGQTKIQEDLYAAADDSGAAFIFEASDVALHDVTTDAPFVTFTANGETERIDCDYIAGCDGSHGVSRAHDPCRCPHRIRQAVSVRLARHFVRDTTATAAHVRQPRARVRTVLHAQPPAESLLRSGSPD